jgi:hypothetical protein
MERFSFVCHFSNNIVCRAFLLVCFPHSRASCDQLNGNEENIKFWALHTLQYLDYKAEVLGGKNTCNNNATFIFS